MQALEMAFSEGNSPRAVNVTREFGILNEFAILYGFKHISSLREVVIFAVKFTSTWLPRRMRNRKAKIVAKLGHEALQQRRLAAARWSADDERPWRAHGLVLLCRTRPM